VIQFEVKGAPRLQTGKGHWRTHAKDKIAWRTAVVVAARQAGWIFGRDRPLERATVRFDCYRSGSAPDADNLRISCKSLLDGLQPRTVVIRGGKPVVGIGCGLIRTDASHCIGTPEVHWHRCARKTERVVITVSDLAVQTSEEKHSD